TAFPSVPRVHLEDAVWFLSCPRQADVERDRFAAAHVHLGREGLVPFLADLDAMAPAGHLHDETIVASRTTPALAVDEHIGVGRLDPDRQRRTLPVARPRGRA